MRQILNILAIVASLAVAAVGQSESACPTITVIGPAGVAQPGDVLRFSVSLEPDVSMQHPRFEWQVSQGVIVGPNDARTLDVRPKKYFSEPTTATVKVLGLPDGCPNSGSETTQTVCDSYLVIGDASWWTQYTEVGWLEERKKLDSLALDGLKKHPEYTIYLEKTFRKETSQKEVQTRSRQIFDYLNKVRGLPRNRIFVRTFRGDGDRTNGYLVPPDAPVLNPKYVDPCLQ